MSRTTAATTPLTAAVAGYLREQAERNLSFADLLDGAPTKAAPALKAVPTTKAKTAPKAAPFVAGSFPKGCCQGCGKTGMVTNPLCRKCRMAGTTEVQEGPSTTSRRLRVVVEAPEAAAPAKQDRRGRDASAHCGAPDCTLFVKKGAQFCAKHQEILDVAHEAAEEAPEVFLTLEDGTKYGYRVPAEFALPLRKKGLEDAVIVKAAKALGKGRKATKDKSSL